MPGSRGPAAGQDPPGKAGREPEQRNRSSPGTAGTRRGQHGDSRGAPAVGHIVPAKQGMRKPRWTGTAVGAVSCPKLSSGIPVGVPKTSVHRVPCSMNREAVRGARQGYRMRRGKAELPLPASMIARREGWPGTPRDDVQAPRGMVSMGPGCGARAWVCPCRVTGHRAAENGQGAVPEGRTGRRRRPHPRGGRWDGGERGGSPHRAEQGPGVNGTRISGGPGEPIPGNRYWGPAPPKPRPLNSSPAPS